MKKIKVVLSTILIASLVFASAIMLTACGKPTLEEYVKTDKDTMQEIETVGNTSGMKIKVKDNTVFYNYNMDTHLSDKQAKDVKKSLDESMKDIKGNFIKQAKTLQKKAKSDTVEIKINYKAEKKTIASYTFSSDDK